MVLLLLFIAPLFEQVPIVLNFILIKTNLLFEWYISNTLQCILAAIIIVALKNIFWQLEDLPRLWRTSIPDFVTSSFTYACAVNRANIHLYVSFMNQYILLHILHQIVWVFTCVATIILDVDLGLIAGFGASLLSIVVRAICSHTATLGVMPTSGEILETSVYPMVWTVNVTRTELIYCYSIFQT